MFTPGSYVPPSGLTDETIVDFCEKLGEHLCKARSESDLSEALVLQLRNLVAPKAVKNYSDYQKVASLAAFEVGEIGERIRRYQYVERYKFFFEPDEKEVWSAFGEHMYELRSQQIYSVLERGSAVLRFCLAVAAESSLDDPKAVTRFAKQFRVRFDRRLRERHRQAHAHERPSLVSRILSLRPRTEEERQMAGEALQGMHAQFMAALDLLTQDSADPSQKMPTEPIAFQKWYLAAVDKESLEMWSIFSEAVAKCVNLSSETGKN